MPSATPETKPVPKSPQRFLKTWGLTFVALTALSGGLSIWFSTALWGYPFIAPDLPATVSEFDEILTITPFEAQAEENAPEGSPLTYQLAPERLSDRNYLQPLGDSGYMGSTKCNTEYCHPSRILVQLVEQGSLTEVKPSLTPAQLLQAEQQLRQTDLLLTTDGDYAETVLWESGLIVEAMADGQRHLFYAINAGQIENDHYPYYEIVFQQDSLATPLELVEMNQFFYEIAGIEGADFRAMWILFTMLSLPVSSVIAVCLYGIGQHRDRAQPSPIA